mmetsp:Transcript_9957/g.32868  ORF Transcript_9957/g.32868 Transcript_9957/m.32868 type:complete len:203 (+) Transcript_9957:378-986(+)
MRTVKQSTMSHASSLVDVLGSSSSSSSSSLSSSSWTVRTSKASFNSPSDCASILRSNRCSFFASDSRPTMTHATPRAAKAPRSASKGAFMRQRTAVVHRRSERRGAAPFVSAPSSRSPWSGCVVKSASLTTLPSAAPGLQRSRFKASAGISCSAQTSSITRFASATCVLGHRQQVESGNRFMPPPSFASSRSRESLSAPAKP